MTAFFYCKAFAPKIKEIFSVSGNFFAKMPRPQQRSGQKPGQIRQRIRPKGPQRPQQLGEGAEKQNRSSQNSQQHKAPQLSRAPAQEKEEYASPRRQAVQRVQSPGEAGKLKPEGPQQIVEQSHRQPQQDGLAKYQQLAQDLLISAPHPIQTGG